jgi:hypothetical protein
VDTESIALEIDETPAVAATGRANTALDQYEKRASAAIGGANRAFQQHGEMIARISDRSRSSVERLAQSAEKLAESYGKSPIERQISQLDQYIKRLGNEEEAVNRVRLAREKLVGVQAKEQAEEASKKQSEAYRGVGERVAGFVEAPLQSAQGALQGLLGTLGPIGVIAGTAAAAVAALGIAGYEAAKSLGEYGTRIYDVQVRTGLTARETQQFAFAARAVGQDVSIVERTMRGLTQAIEDESTKGEQARGVLRGFGVDVEAVRQGLVPTSQVLLQIGQGLEATHGQWQRNKDALDLFRRAGIEALPFFLELTENMKESERFHFLSDADVERLRGYQREVAGISTAWDLLTVKLKQPLAATVLVGLKWLTSGGDVDKNYLVSSAEDEIRRRTEGIIGQAVQRSEDQVRSQMAAQAGVAAAAPSESLLTAQRYSGGLEGARKQLEDLKKAYDTAYQAQDDLRKSALQHGIVTTAQAEQAIKATRGAAAAYHLQEEAVKSLERAESNRRSNLESLAKLQIEMAEKARAPYGLAPADQKLLEFSARPGVTREQVAQAREIIAPERIREAVEAVTKIQNLALENARLTAEAATPLARPPKSGIDLSRELRASQEAAGREMQAGLERQTKLLEQDERIVAATLAAQREISESQIESRIRIAGILDTGPDARFRTEAQLLEVRKQNADDLYRYQRELAGAQHAYDGQLDDALTELRTQHARQVSDIQIQLAENAANLERQQIESIAKPAESLLHTLFTNPHHFGEELKKTLMDAFLKPLEEGLAQITARALQPAIYGEGGQGGLQSLLSSIPHFQDGAVVNQPTVALFGEAGPEAVLPLSGNWLENLQKLIGYKGSGQWDTGHGYAESSGVPGALKGIAESPAATLGETALGAFGIHRIVDSQQREAERLVKQLYHKDIDRKEAQHIVDIADEKYGRHVSVAVRSQEVRDSLGMWAPPVQQHFQDGGIVQVAAHAGEAVLPTELTNFLLSAANGPASSNADQTRLLNLMEAQTTAQIQNTAMLFGFSSIMSAGLGMPPLSVPAGIGGSVTLPTVSTSSVTETSPLGAIARFTDATATPPVSSPLGTMTRLADNLEGATPANAPSWANPPTASWMPAAYATPGYAATPSWMSAAAPSYASSMPVASYAPSAPYYAQPSYAPSGVGGGSVGSYGPLLSMAPTLAAVPMLAGVESAAEPGSPRTPTLSSWSNMQEVPMVASALPTELSPFDGVAAAPDTTYSQFAGGGDTTYSQFAGASSGGDSTYSQFAPSYGGPVAGVPQSTYRPQAPNVAAQLASTFLGGGGRVAPSFASVSRLVGGPGGTSGFTGPVTGFGGTASRGIPGAIATSFAAGGGGFRNLFLGPNAPGTVQSGSTGIPAGLGSGEAPEDIGTPGGTLDNSSGESGGMFSGAPGGLAGAGLQVGGTALLQAGLMGNQRGQVGGIFEGAAGGAMMGMALGGPIGAAIGAAAGFAAGIGEMIAGVESPQHEAERLARQIYHIGINGTTANQIVALAQQKYAGHVSVAIRDPQIRQMLELYAAGTGQIKNFPQSATTPHGGSLVETGGQLQQQAVYQFGNAYTYQSSLPTYGGVPSQILPSPGVSPYSGSNSMPVMGTTASGGGSVPGGPSQITHNLQLDGPSTIALLRGEVQQVVTPDYTQQQYSDALDSSNGRLDNSATIQAPGLIIS